MIQDSVVLQSGVYLDVSRRTNQRWRGRVASLTRDVNVICQALLRPKGTGLVDADVDLF